MFSDIYDHVVLDKLFFVDSYLGRWSIQYEDNKGEVTERDIVPMLRVATSDGGGVAAWCFLRQSIRYFTYAGILHYQRAGDTSMNDITVETLVQHIANDRRHADRIRGVFQGPVRSRIYPEHAKVRANRSKAEMLQELFDHIDATPALTLATMEGKDCGCCGERALRHISSHSDRERFIAEFIGVDQKAFHDEKEALYDELCEHEEHREKRAARLTRKR